MSTVSIPKFEFLCFSRGAVEFRPRSNRTSAAWMMTMDSKNSEKGKVEEISVRIPSISLSPVPQHESPLRESDLRFDRPQPSESELLSERKLEFGSFVAREAVIDEEIWCAAWLRSESHFEDQFQDRYIDSHKRKFAELEFNEIRKRRRWPQVQKTTCIVSVKKGVTKVKRIVPKSVVGTLDLSVRYLLPGETFPGEKRRVPPFCTVTKTPQNRYCYIANLCVLKSTRRQGIASNMLFFAVESAKLEGVEQLYVHVHTHNEAAQELYRKIGFQIVEMATPQLSNEQMFLLSFNM